jgi:DNA-binding beta-propeller fold protein YncE
VAAVTDFRADSVFEYAAGATDNAVPAATIAGLATYLSDPSGIALDPRGDIYVANDKSITVYAAGSKGNVPPMATISGELTELFAGVFIGKRSWSLAVGPLPR